MSSFEEIVAERGERSGALMTIGVHSTLLGPALGGARFWHYDCTDDAVADAMRLAEAMTHKAAAAGLDLGGGKGVIAAPGRRRPEGWERREILLDFGDLVESLEGRYVTAEDVGTGSEDMDVIAERTSHVVGLSSGRGGSGDPSPVTALGVMAAMRACAEQRFGSRDLGGRTVAVVGIGHVGSHLAALLAEQEADVIASDIDPGREPAARGLGARWADPAEALLIECDVLAPCALGAVIDDDTAERLRCEILCGAANNVLTKAGVAGRLRERGILYAPDFIANVGGLISVYGEFRGSDHAESLRLAMGIERTMADILATARESGITPLAAARRLSEARLVAALRAPEGGGAGSTAMLAGSRLRHS